MYTVITTRGTKKNSYAICNCENKGKFEVRINKIPLGIHPDILMVAKFDEILNLLPEDVYGSLDFEITTSIKEGVSVGRIYAARQSFCKAILAYLGKCSDEHERQKIKNAILSFDRFAIVADTRVKEPKKFGGPGARARYQKLYR